jgi:chromosome segregation ATPase
MIRIFLIVLSGLALLGCGSSNLEQTRLEDQKVISDLKAKLVDAQSAMEVRQHDIDRLTRQIQDVTGKNNELQNLLSAKAEQKPAKSEPPGRVELLGAKALAEYKAEQLSRRVEKLTADLDRKEQELAEINKTTKTQATEVEQLRQTVAQFQKTDANRTAELQARMESVSKQLKERSDAAEQFRQELNERTELLNALKNAVADASKLKTNAESENAKLRQTLEETKKQLEAANTATEEARQEAVKFHAYGEQIYTQLGQWKQYAEQMKQESERLNNELQTATNEVAQLQEQVQTLQAEMQKPSTVERLLQPPDVPGEQQTKSLY